MSVKRWTALPEVLWEYTGTSTRGIFVTAADYDALQASYDQLTGEKFSDRVHVALRDRARRAEAENEALRAALQKIADGWPERDMAPYEAQVALDALDALKRTADQPPVLAVSKSTC